MEKFDVIIIGGGASGLMCALHSKQKTLLIEASDRVGKKILATGNGKCNLTNDVLDVQFYNTSAVAPYFAQFDQVQTLKYFNQLGLYTYADEAGRRYPLANSANAVLDLLLKALSLQHNVTVRVNTLPTKIIQTPDGFTVTTPEQTYACRKLVLATGGNSGMQYLQQLSVPYRAFQPSLMGLKTKKNKGLAGVRVSNVRVQFQQFDEVGEVLFKEDGISGIVIFNLSAHLSRQQITNGTLMIDLLTGINAQQLIHMLQASVAHNPSYSMVDVLEGLLHKSLARNVLERLGMEQTLAGNCTEQQIVNLVQTLKNYSITFTGYADNNQVHTGGVELKTLDNHLQYQKIKGLYFIGEVVNVDGVCGGYNLQWAWTSGKIVGDQL